ncbi:MAG TPA: 50S ribosomal protein L11 methyltransferase [Burkholderiales bacterium]|nr:50S ribosomal protein L11 methyltransferase [Burkholderiales bacterium]
MSWRSLNVETDILHAEALSEALLQLGALSVDIADASAGAEREPPQFGAPGGPPTAARQPSRVSGLFPAHADISSIVKDASIALHLPAGRYTITEVGEQDWVRLSQAQFTPLKISPRLWIVPSWHMPPDPDAVNIRLDPGLAFGTGSHPSTRLCLRWLDENIIGGETVLDYGCGSGILAIAAVKLGAGRAFGVDSDPQAVLASQANSEKNGVQAEYYCAQAAPPIHANVVLANILADPLKLLAPLLAEATCAGGTLVLSGILAAQAHDVEHAYRDWFDFYERPEEQGWVRLSAKKRFLP